MLDGRWRRIVHEGLEVIEDGLNFGKGEIGARPGAYVFSS